MDWHRNGMPCKHLLAVLTYYEGLSWDSLPEQYRNFPLFTIDETVAQSGKVSHDNFLDSVQEIDEESELFSNHTHGVINCESHTTEEQCTMSSIQDKADANDFTIKLQSQCRQLMNTLSSYTYKISDVSVLDAVIVDMQRILNVCKSHVQKTSLSCYHTVRRRKPAKKNNHLSYLVRRFRFVRNKRKRKSMVNKYIKYSG
jgi:hypothetical protein